MAQLCALVGAACIFTAYVALCQDWLDYDSPVYYGLNLAGSALLLAVSVADQRWPLVVFNVVWCVMAMHGLWRQYS